MQKAPAPSLPLLPLLPLPCLSCDPCPSPATSPWSCRDPLSRCCRLQQRPLQPPSTSIHQSADDAKVGQGQGGQAVPLCEGCRTETQVGSPCCCLPFLLHSTCHCCSYASPALCPCCKSPTAQPPHLTPRILPPLLIPTRPQAHTPHLACFLAACLVAACQDDMCPHACQRLAGGQPNAGVGACHDAHLHISWTLVVLEQVYLLAQ